MTANTFPPPRRGPGVQHRPDRSSFSSPLYCTARHSHSRCWCTRRSRSDSNISSRLDSRRHYGDSAARPAGQLHSRYRHQSQLDSRLALGFSRNAAGTIRCNCLLSPNSNAILSPAQELALQNFISSGKGFVGIHGAVSFERDWDWYRQLLGAHFGRHNAGPNMNEPPIADATVNVISAGSSFYQ